MTKLQLHCKTFKNIYILAYMCINLRFQMILHDATQNGITLPHIHPDALGHPPL